jgi:hypothetical protein
MSEGYKGGVEEIHWILAMGLDEVLNVYIEGSVARYFLPIYCFHFPLQMSPYGLPWIQGDR